MGGPSYREMMMNVWTGRRGSVAWWFTVIMGMMAGAVFFMLAYRFMVGESEVLHISTGQALISGINNFISIAIGSPSEMEQVYSLPSFGKEKYTLSFEDEIVPQATGEPLLKKKLYIDLGESKVDLTLSARNIVSSEIRYPQFKQLAIKKFSMANTFSSVSMTTNIVLIYPPLEMIIIPDCVGATGHEDESQRQKELISKITDSLSNYDEVIIPGDREYMFFTKKKSLTISYAFDLDMVRKRAGLESACDYNVIENILATNAKGIFFPNQNAKKVVVVITQSNQQPDAIKAEVAAAIPRVNTTDVIVLQRSTNDAHRDCPYRTRFELNVFDKETYDEHEFAYYFCPTQNAYPLLQYVVSPDGPFYAAAYQYNQLYSYINRTKRKTQVLKRIFCPKGKDCPCPLSGSYDKDQKFYLNEVQVELESILAALEGYRDPRILLETLDGMSDPVLYDDQYCIHAPPDASALSNCIVTQSIGGRLSSKQSKLLECSLPRV
ncbi:MAG: hypothetical protein QGG50_00200 [Methanopyri archaeon]|nr:hypothetical protein [Methanopyri archaeon]